MNPYKHMTILTALVISMSYSNETATVSPATIDSLVQNGSQLIGDVTTITEPVQSFDFGTNGAINISKFAFPKDSFSFESKFLLKDYNPTDPMISDILASFDCDYDNTGTGKTEGVDFRVGGGYLYPLKSQDTYDSYSDWEHPTAEQKIARQTISNRIGQFGLGSGTASVWKEIYTDRCIEKNVWTHMVATWNGSTMKIYLNGHDATDTWRILGKDLPAFIQDTSNVFIGAENADSERHFNGQVAYIKIYNQVLTESDIYQKYIETIGSTQCIKFIKIESPLCGEIISPDTKLKFSIGSDYYCDSVQDPHYYQIEISHDQSFTNADSIYTYSLDSTECVFRDFIGNDSSDFEGLFFMRIKGINSNGLQKTTGTSDIIAESGTLPTYAIVSPVKVKKVTTILTSSKQNILQNTMFDCRGRMIKSSSDRIYNTKLQNGIYFSKSNNEIGKRMLYVK